MGPLSPVVSEITSALIFLRPNILETAVWEVGSRSYFCEWFLLAVSYIYTPESTYSSVNYSITSSILCARHARRTVQVKQKAKECRGT